MGASLGRILDEHTTSLRSTCVANVDSADYFSIEITQSADAGGLVSVALSWPRLVP